MKGRDKKPNKKESTTDRTFAEGEERISPINIVTEMRESYLDYSMSVIVGRALPDVRDGLKPVHRRILFSINELGLTASSKFRKSATVVGDVLGKYHPHGDSACYDAMVRMAQDFAMRYPLVAGQGNFGCFTKDTKVRLADGRNLSFEELINEDKTGKTNYTFTVDSEGKVVIAPIVKPRLTREKAEILTVVLDNDEEIKCTPNHRFLLKSGEYLEAQNLKAGLYLMPVDINKGFQVKKVVFGGGYEDVYDLTVNETHNFALAAGVFVHNSIDGDSAAAMRYTEAKMSKLTAELLRDIDKETVDFIPNYDGSRQEPTVLPSVVPNLLLNGAMGIAVGMATKIPPHNLTELMDALAHLADHPEATTEDLLEFVKGPDFPTGGLIFNQEDIRHAYATGRGGVLMRGEAEIIENKAGNYQIIISSIPYQVNKSELIVKIADLVRDKKVEGIRDIRDESTRDIRVAIDLKAGAHPQKILNALYKHTDLETTFNYNMLMLVEGVPKLLPLRSILEEFLGHRQIIITRRTKYDLRKAEERAHILEGLKKALDHIDEIIKLIKKSKDGEEAKVNLIKVFKFSELQAVAILEMRLQKLAGLERKKIEDELKEKLDLIKELKAILADPKKVLAIIKTEFLEIREKYGDARRTKVIRGGAKEINLEDLVPEKEDVLVLTAGGYIKRTDPSEYRAQKRGGVGVIDLNMKEEDFVTTLVTANTHDDLLFFTNRGKAYQIKMYDVPEGKRATRGKSIMNFLSLADDETVTSILPMPKELKNVKFSLVLVTQSGEVKKVSADSFKDVRRSGIIAIKLEVGDLLLSVSTVEKGDQMILTAQSGQSICFKESEVREMGRAAGGVRAIKLKKGDLVVGADKIPADLKDGRLLVMTNTGHGKQTLLKEFKVQKRGGSGIKAANITKKTGPLMVSKVLDGSQQEIIAISKQGQIIRTNISEIPTIGRATQGVKIMKLKEGDGLASVTCL